MTKNYKALQLALLLNQLRRSSQVWRGVGIHFYSLPGYDLEFRSTKEIEAKIKQVVRSVI